MYFPVDHSQSPTVQLGPIDDLDRNLQVCSEGLLLRLTFSPVSVCVASFTFPKIPFPIVRSKMYPLISVSLGDRRGLLSLESSELYSSSSGYSIWGRSCQAAQPVIGVALPGCWERKMWQMSERCLRKIFVLLLCS